MMADSDGDEEMEVVEHEEDGDDLEVDEGSTAPPRVFLPGRDKMEEGEALEMDEKAYKVYYSLTPEWSCMSFDVIRDNLGEDRTEKYPLTSYIVTGTSANPSHLNKLQVMKLSNLRPLRSDDKEDNDSESDSDSEDLDAQAEVEAAGLRHNGIVNRVRCSEHAGACLAASWSEHGIVYTWDLSRPLTAVNDSLAMAEYLKARDNSKPLFAFNGHKQEGYALDWNRQTPGSLLTGDCAGLIFHWKTQSGAASWSVSPKPLTAHTASVEDIQWSPTEATVFCSCSVDRSLRVWDVRAPADRACQITVPNAHDTDINVISWNPKDTSLILSGADDGHLKVWDLRQFVRRDGSSPTPVVALRHHRDPITSVEWHPTESSMFAASASGPQAGDQLTLWDISVEQSVSEESSDEGLPPQLMFVHMGQKELKELHWHPQMPSLLLSTAADSFNIFRTINM